MILMDNLCTYSSLSPYGWYETIGQRMTTATTAQKCVHLWTIFSYILGILLVPLGTH